MDPIKTKFFWMIKASLGEIDNNVYTAVGEILENTNNQAQVLSGVRFGIPGSGTGVQHLLSRDRRATVSSGQNVIPLSSHRNRSSGFARAGVASTGRGKARREALRERLENGREHYKGVTLFKCPKCGRNFRWIDSFNLHKAECRRQM